MTPSPYLQLLLRKRPELSPIPTTDDPSTDPTQVPLRTIPIGPRPNITTTDVAAPIVPAQPVDQQPTVPLNSKADISVAPAGMATPSAPVITKPRDVIADDRAALIAAQNKKPPSLGRRILEGVGEYAASGAGFPLKRILHPRGTETEQAQRQLATDLGIQKAQTENQDAQSTISLRSAQQRKIDDALTNPDTSEADKAKFELAKEILKSHPQGFDRTDPADIVALKKLEDAGIPIPASYGKQPKETAPHNPLLRERKNKDGTVSTLQSDDYGKTWKEAPDLTSAAPPSPAPEDVPDTTTGLATLEKGFRTNAAAANSAALKAENDVKTYIAQQKAADPNYNEKADPNVSSMMAEANRQRAYAKDQLSRADSVAVEKVKAGNTDAERRAKSKKTRSGVAPTTHNFSLRAWLLRNPGKTEADARAFHDASPQYKDYAIAP